MWISKATRRIAAASSFYRNTLIEKTKRDAFLSDISQNLTQFENACKTAPRPNDFKPIKDRPLLSLQAGEYIMSDLGCLADKLDSGVFWRVHNQGLASGAEREGLHRFWGHVFEEYVSKLLEHVCNGSPNQFLPSPRFRNDDQACDCMILSGTTGILIEAKGSTMIAEAKFSGSPDTLATDLASKFVGTEEKPKGIRQLARTITKWAGKTDSQDIVGVSPVTKIFPVLIARDSVLSSPLVNYWLNELFKTLFNRKRIRSTVTPLFVLTVDELEQISAYLIDTPLCEILECRYRKNPALGMPFSAVQNDLIASRPARGNLFIEKRFKQLVDEACMDCFGKPYMRPSP